MTLIEGVSENALANFPTDVFKAYEFQKKGDLNRFPCYGAAKNLIFGAAKNPRTQFLLSFESWNLKTQLGKLGVSLLEVPYNF